MKEREFWKTYHPNVPLMSNQAIERALELLHSIQAALGTEEGGESLVDVARNAHKAEQELAMLERRYPGFRKILEEEYTE